MKTTNQIARHAFAWSCMAIIAMLLQWTASAQTLVHEYSFHDTSGSTNCADSIGGAAWEGEIYNGGTNAIPGLGPDGGGFTGSQLILLAADQDYVQLPPYILSNYTAVTIDAWITFGTLPANCMLYSFGDTDPNVLSGGAPSGFDYIFMQPENGRIAISDVDPGYEGEQGTGGAGDLSSQMVHVTSVYNPPAGYVELYTNGVLVSRGTGITIPMNQVSNVISYLARSLYWADGYYDSEWSEFRVWNGALNGLQVEACDVNGSGNPSDNYGTVTNLQFTLPYYQLVQGTHESPSSVLAQATGAPTPADVSTWASYSSSNTNILTTTNNIIYAIGQGSASVIASFGGISSTQIVTVVQPASILTHRYSFSDANGSTTVADSVGGLAWNGAVMTNGPTPGPYPGVFSGSQLTISSNLSEYVQLPSGIISNYNAVTIEAWATFPDALPGNCFFFGFGNTDSGGAGEDYIYMQPSSGHIGITGADPGYTAEQQAAGYGNLSSTTNLHIAAVFNPGAGWIAVYTNGVLVGKNLAVTTPLSEVSSVLNYICRSLYTGDQYMDASLDEFRIYNGALTSQGVAISDAAGPNSIPAGVTNGPGSLLSLTLQAPSSIEAPFTAQLKLLANYTGLTNWDIIGNSIFPPAGLTISSSDTNVLWIDSNNVLHSQYPGQATVTVVYQGTTNTATIAVTQSAARPSLVHRYSFSDANGSTTCADSIGGSAWNGTVMASGTNAVPTGGAFTNGVLWLNAAITNFVQLPSGILSNYTAMTIEGWVTAQTLPANCMYYAFGNTDSGGAGENYIFGSLVRDYTCITAVDPGYTAEQGTSGASPLPLNTPIHWVAVYDPPEGYIALYTNGVFVSMNTSVTDPLSAVSPVEAFIGRSLYTGDPYASIALDEFRIYNGVMSPADVAASDSLGPNQVLTTNARITATPSGNNLVLTWPAAASGFTLQSKTSLTSGTWTTVTPAATLVGGNWQTAVPKTGGTQFFRLVR